MSMKISDHGFRTALAKGVSLGAMATLALPLIIILSCLSCVSRAAGAKPNIVLILADDLGWADVSFHGGQIKTPNLDALAARGTRLEQFYVQPLCSPTRAALMTGRYPMRHGLQVGVVKPQVQYGLPLDERTLPQALREAGYTTAICGKWHLGHFQRDYLPTQRGFDHQYGHYNGAIDYYTHLRDGGLDWHRDDAALIEEGYSTHLIAQDTAIPLFLYVPFNAVHAPHQAPEEYSAPYTAMTGDRRIYAGMVAAMDEDVGRIVAAVEQKGIRGNTLFIFSSDNGGPAPGKITDNGPLREGKGTLYEGGVRVPAFATWDGHLKPGTVVNAPMHIADWYPTLLTIAGASLKQDKPLDSFNMWPTIADGKPSPRREILHNTAPGTGALRMGDWKLVLNGHRRDTGESDKPKKPKNDTVSADAAERVELFNLASDPYEEKNLVTQQPDKLKELRVRYDELAAQAVPPKDHDAPPGWKVPKVWGEKD
jgi:arylsulfatase A-like enzyme